MKAQALIATARTLFVGDEGVLAIDEGIATCSKRFASLGIPQSEETRRACRELIVDHPRTRWVHQRRHPLRRDDPPVDEGWHSLRQGRH